MTEPRHESHAPRLPTDLAALAARLDRAPAASPRHLRERVLGAVIDALAEPAAVPRDLLPPGRPEPWRESIAALAALVALLLVGPWLGAIAPPPSRPRVPRLDVAGIEPFPPAPPPPSVAAPLPPPAAPLSALALRGIPAVRVAQGDFR